MTLEQCKKLKEWGLPQGESDYICCESANEPKYIIRQRSQTLCDRTIWHACPDLEQLLEFAKRECRKRFFVLALDDRSAGGWSADGGWIDNGETLRFTDPDPKVAVYKLLEKILEAEYRAAVDPGKIGKAKREPNDPSVS